MQVADDELLDIPSDAALLDMAAGVADEAVTLTGRDPLPTPITVVRALAAVAQWLDLVPAEQRLVRLAAAASRTVLANAQLELYPPDLDAVPRPAALPSRRRRAKGRDEPGGARRPGIRPVPRPRSAARRAGAVPAAPRVGFRPPLGRRPPRPTNRDRLEQRAAIGIDLAESHPAGGRAGRWRAGGSAGSRAGARRGADGDIPEVELGAMPSASGGGDGRRAGRRLDSVRDTAARGL
jgi:hypothetical protein